MALYTKNNGNNVKNGISSRY